LSLVCVRACVWDLLCLCMFGDLVVFFLGCNGVIVVLVHGRQCV
jgi:hypothetical protein